MTTKPDMVASIIPTFGVGGKKDSHRFKVKFKTLGYLRLTFKTNQNKLTSIPDKV